MWAEAGGPQGPLQAASPVACDAPGCEYSPGAPQGCEWQQVHVGPCCWGWGHSSARSQGSQVRKKRIILSFLVGFSFLSFPSFLLTGARLTFSITVPTKLCGGSGEGDDGRAWAGLGASPKDRALLELDPHGAGWGTERSPLHSHPLGTASSCEVPEFISAPSHQGTSPWVAPGLICCLAV